MNTEVHLLADNGVHEARGDTFSDEAEIHDFANRLKEQSRMVDELTAELAQQRVDSSQAHQKHVKWQEQLREKIAAYRDERKQWYADAVRLRSELAEATAVVQRQRDELGLAKNERFKLQNQVLEMRPKILHIEDYETRMKQLTDTQRLWDNDVEKCKETQMQAEIWRGRCHELAGLLHAAQEEIDTCRHDLSQLDKTISRQPYASVDSADSRSVQHSTLDMEKTKEAAELAQRHIERLERENLELRAECEALRESRDAYPEAVTDLAVHGDDIALL